MTREQSTAKFKPLFWKQRYQRLHDAYRVGIMAGQCCHGCRSFVYSFRFSVELVFVNGRLSLRRSVDGKESRIRRFSDKMFAPITLSNLFFC
jgi:hypothetical protein